MFKQTTEPYLARDEKSKALVNTNRLAAENYRKLRSNKEVESRHTWASLILKVEELDVEVSNIKDIVKMILEGKS